MLTDNLGAGAKATVVVSGGTVTSFTITTPGNRYAVGDELYIDGVTFSSGAGFVTTVATVSASWGTVTYTDGTADQNGGLGVGATLSPASNGLFVLDAVAPLVNDRVLIRTQTDMVENGIYVVTSTGSPTSTWLLTRATDYDNSIINQVVPGNYVFVTDGKINKNTGWTETGIGTSSVPGTKDGAIVIGTDDIIYSQFSGTTVYSAGTGLELLGNEFTNTGVLSVTTNTGLSTNVSAIGNVTITNTGVTSLIAGTGISLSGSTGNVTVSATVTVPSTVAVNSNYTVLAANYTVLADASAGGFTVSLPASPVDGEIHNIKKVDQTRSAVIISGNGNDIDKYTSIVVDVPFTSMEIQWSSVLGQWYII